MTGEGKILSVLAQRSIVVEGSGGLGVSPRPDLIGPVLAGLRGSLLDSVRMGFLHSSRPRGRVPTMLKAASDVRFIGHEGDGDRATLLRFELPTFGTVAGEMFRQPSLWDDGPTPDETALDLFGAALNDVGNRRAESSRFDPGLLRRIRSYRHVLARGIDRILIGGAIPARSGQVDPDVMDAASELFAATPSPRRLRVTGRLDVMGASQGVLKLDVRPGQTVTALWEGHEPIESLRNCSTVMSYLKVSASSGRPAPSFASTRTRYAAHRRPTSSSARFRPPRQFASTRRSPG